MYILHNLLSYSKGAYKNGESFKTICQPGKKRAKAVTQYVKKNRKLYLFKRFLLLFGEKVV